MKMPEAFSLEIPQYRGQGGVRKNNLRKPVRQNLIIPYSTTTTLCCGTSAGTNVSSSANAAKNPSCTGTRPGCPALPAGEK